MMLWPELCVLLVSALLMGRVGGFNLAPKAATVIGEPRTQSNYFGFTVNLQKRTDEDRGTSYWLIVGAPKTNASSHQRVLETGAVYQCDLADITCTPIALDDTANEEGISPIGRMSYRHMHNHSWVGGAVAVQEQQGEKIVVCGPRTKWIYNLYKNAYLINGLFYLKTYPFESTENAKKYIPLYNITNQLYRFYNTLTGRNQSSFLYTHGQSGFSAHFTKDGSDMLIGAPGVKSWTGTVIRYRNLGASNESVIIPHPGKIPQLDEYAYFGYAISSGQFLSASSNTHYVGGAPRAGLMTGKVLVFEFQEKTDDNVNVLIELEGFQMGEYFGASVCVVDLNGDGLDDLVVGAPQHSLEDAGLTQSGGDEGRVYVFINEDNSVLREIGERNKILGSQTKHARFGTAVANAGDLNLDGYNDIAVGAPYEDSGRGAIYIYHGRSSGIQHKYSQRITAAEIHTSLSGFGISISRGADIDGNYYNDLAVGAFHSGHAVLIYSQPVVAVRTRLSSDVTNLGLNATGFAAIACISYSGKHAPATAGLLVTLEVISHDDKASFAPKGNPANRSNTYQYYRLLNYNKEHCDNVPVEIRKGGPEDYTRPIELHLTYKLDHRHQTIIPVRRKRLAALHEDGNTGFCSTCPVVDPSHKSKSSWTVPYAHDCGDDDVCRTDLSVEVDFVDSKPPFVLGAQPKLSLRVLVSNRGEQAFLVKLNVTVPRETPLSRLPTMCQEVTESEEEGPTQLECDMGSVLAAGAQKMFNLEVEMGGLSARIKVLEYTFNVTSVGEEQVHQDNFYEMIIPIQTIPDVSIQGTSSQNKGNHTKNNQVFYHTYDVRNYGPSPADVLRLKFHIPVSARSRQGNIKFMRVFKPSAYFDNQPITCSPVSGHTFDADERETDVDDADNALEELRSLRKRSIDIARLSNGESNVYLDPNSHSDTSLLPANRTLVVNCSGPVFECMVVHCDAGPFKTTQNRAVISFRLVADFVKIEPITGKKDIVVISSRGELRIQNLPDAVQPPDGRPDETSVNSVFFGSLPEETVDSLLLALSIAVGILILFLIVGALAKMGFFLRSKRSELNELKEECGGRLVEGDNDSEDDLQNVNLSPTTQKLET